jgi:ribonuclease R
MKNLEAQILTAIGRKNYHPLKPKALARKLGLTPKEYAGFREALKTLARQGRIQISKSHTIRTPEDAGTVAGILRKTSAGFGFVRPHQTDGSMGEEIFIQADRMADASTGDEVLVRILGPARRRDHGPRGEILQVLERASHQFVGTYFERDGQGFVRVDGTVFSHSILVGDPGAKGAKPEDKVVFEMLRFPSPEDRGEGVITEILGPRGQPGVDTLSIIRAFGLPDQFPDDALEEAREAAALFSEKEISDREDFTSWLTITIDPVTAHDFDDAVSLTRDAKTGHWLLAVHIADVCHFVQPGGPLDREARKRGTSVYLPQRVIPMLPEIISNNLASLQQDKVRYVKSVLIDLTPAGQKTSVRITNAAIRVRRRFAYEEVSEILLGIRDSSGRDARRVSHRVSAKPVDPEILDLLHRMRELALILQHRRIKRGALTLNMPEVELQYDDQGRVTGGHFASHDISHQIIEEFMLAANESVAELFDREDIPFIRRIHPAPEPAKLKHFTEFARMLGYKMAKETDRFSLQRVLEASADKPERHAVHYALLRSLKQAVYSPLQEEHYALAGKHYCHFTSPIRRYPDLTIHRLVNQWVKKGRAGGDKAELVALGEHCSHTERRAANAERELVKLKLLHYMSERLGQEMEVIITGVADYGFYGQAEDLPVEGLVPISTLPNDYYYFDEASHTLVGQRTRRRFRLGDKVYVQVVRVDLQRRQMDFRVIKK